MTHLFGNSERVVHKSNSNVKRVLWQINSICAAIITHLGNSGAKETQVLRATTSSKPVLMLRWFKGLISFS